MINLRLPEGMLSVTVFGQSYGEPDGTIRGVEDHVAREIMAHDPRITQFETDAADDPATMPGAGDNRVALMARIADLDRTELFAIGRSMRVSLPATLKTEALRELVIRHAATMHEDDIPLVIGISRRTETSDGVKMMPQEVADSPNRGNDSLSKQGQHLTGGTAGATFSQGTLAGHAVADQPAPAGLGPVQLTGTQQPPYNQLDTNTGKPTKDQGAAPFPISVPPINPQTGKPYDAGDPRIPATALPPLREAPQPGVDETHIDADHHEFSAGDAIYEASGKLDDKVAGTNQGNEDGDTKAKS